MESIERARQLNVISKHEHQKLLAWNNQTDALREIYRRKRKLSYDVAYSAALGGHLDLLKWLWEIKCNMHHAMKCSAQIGHREAIEWGISVGLSMEGCIARAARNSDLNMMKFLKERGAELDSACYVSVMNRNTNDRMAKLDWLHERNCPVSDETIVAAGLSEDLTAVEWLARNFPQLDLNSLMAPAAQRGSIAILEWGLENGLNLNKQCMISAAGKSTLETMKWLRAHNCPWNHKAYTAAVIASDPEKVEWLHQMRCPLPQNTTKADLLERIAQGDQQQEDEKLPECVTQ